MIKTIAKKEFTEFLRDGRFRWTALTVFALLLVSLGLGWKNYSTVKRDHDLAQKESRESWENQGSRNPHSAAHFGVYAFKPKLRLSLVDTGLDSYTGKYIWVEAHFQNPSRGRPVEDATALQRFGEMTAAGVLQLLLPLLIIFLAFDSFAGERERGTLRQVLSLGISRFELVLGKSIGLLAVLFLLLLPATVIGVLALALSNGNENLLSSGSRFALMSLSYLLYFGAFIGISLTVSALAVNSRTSLILLLAFWIFGCLIVPRIANDLAERYSPVPSGKEFWAGVEKSWAEGIDGHNPDDKRVQDLKDKILAQYGVTKVEDLPINFNGIQLQAGEEHSNLVFDKHFGSLWQKYFAQEKIHNLSGILSPLMGIRAASMGFAGTDLAQHKHFSDAVEQYRRPFVKMLNENFAFNSKTADDYNYFVNREIWEKSPQFIYSPPDTGWVLERQWLNLAGLLFWCFGALGIAVFSANRMKAF